MKHVVAAEFSTSIWMFLALCRHCFRMLKSQWRLMFFKSPHTVLVVGSWCTLCRLLSSRNLKFFDSPTHHRWCCWETRLIFRNALFFLSMGFETPWQKVICEKSIYQITMLPLYFNLGGQETKGAGAILCSWELPDHNAQHREEKRTNQEIKFWWYPLSSWIQPCSKLIQLPDYQFYEPISCLFAQAIWVRFPVIYNWRLARRPW